MKTFIKLTIPAFLILLFSYAAISKLSNPDIFRSQLYRQPFSHALADVLLYALPLSEFIAISLLLFERTRFAGLLLSAGLLLVFSGYISLGLLRFWTKIPCSCGGILNHMSWGAHLIFNCAFLMAALTGIFYHYSDRRQANHMI
jgi:putative oxidoreductase